MRMLLDKYIRQVTIALAILVVASATWLSVVNTLWAPDKDQDGDGYSTLQGDCNDANPEIHPTALDPWYDGVDQNCDSQNDFDQDRDGCASNAGDCDDTDQKIHPGAIEIWYNSIDEDCDGNDDDKDKDGDPKGTDPGQDCDDTNLAIHPGATEIPDDGIDQNCDGLFDYATKAEEDAARILERIKSSLNWKDNRRQWIFDATVGVETYRGRIPTFNQRLTRDQGRERYGCQFEVNDYLGLAEDLEILWRIGEADRVRFMAAWVMYQGWDYCADQGRTEPNWIEASAMFERASYPGLSRQALYDGAKSWLNKNAGEGDQDKQRENVAHALQLLRSGGDPDKTEAMAWVRQYALRLAKKTQVPDPPVDTSPGPESEAVEP